MSLCQCKVEIVDTVIDKLGLCVKRAVFIFEKLIFDFGIKRVLNRTYVLACQNQYVVITHVVGRHTELHALVIINIGIPGITAVQDNHADILYVPADQIDNLFQVGLFLFG